jgi:hypothetical protein
MERMGREPVMRNNHHIFFTRAEYKTPIERNIRNMGAFIVRVNAVDHQEMHHFVPPPPKPDHEQLHDLKQFMQEHTYELEGLEGLEWGIVWSNDRKLYTLEENLENQHYYLSGEYRGK